MNLSYVDWLRRWALAALLMLVALCCLPNNASAVSALTKTDPKVTADSSVDSYGRDSPRSTMQNFVKALSDKDMALVEKYLDEDFLKKTKRPRNHH